MIPEAIILACAVGLDLLIGDPFNQRHPVVFMGRLAHFLEAPCRRFIKAPLLAGALAWFVVVGVSGLCGWALTTAAELVHPLLGDLVSIWIIYTCLAMKSLFQHIHAVYLPLSKGNLAEARLRVSWVVGRDTQDMEEEDVARAAVESAAENLVDGVMAPLFWAFVGGPTGILIFKAVSTLDSTFGYRNQQYLYFGRISARMDDVASFIPARLAGPVMALSAALNGFHGWRSFRIFLRDRLKHTSPNAGHGEAAAAGALGIRLGGMATYGGMVGEKPFLGDSCQAIKAIHIKWINQINMTTSLLFALLMICLVSWKEVYTGGQ